jgi:hypothetical protein
MCVLMQTSEIICHPLGVYAEKRGENLRLAGSVNRPPGYGLGLSGDDCLLNMSHQDT